MRILGIDPGLASTGVGVIERQGEVWRLVDSREVRTSSSAALPGRLQKIHNLVAGEIDAYQPQSVAIESIFFAKNVRSAVLMAHGRGVAILAASTQRLPVFEYSPLEIKQSVLGNGRASKTQVMQMVKVLLGLEKLPASDHQADALACALAHAYRSESKARLAQGDDSTDASGTEDAKALLALAKRSRHRRRR
ncbi:crossover junction endodeoxyribonuclease RuvC [bacterium]|nr:crossover junction endodeoxyribonuclease RuvC [bacterium]